MRIYARANSVFDCGQARGNAPAASSRKIDTIIDQREISEDIVESPQKSFRQILISEQNFSLTIGPKKKKMQLLDVAKKMKKILIICVIFL